MYNCVEFTIIGYWSCRQITRVEVTFTKFGMHDPKAPWYGYDFGPKRSKVKVAWW